MKVTIAGPNLRDQSKGEFEVHATGCGDIARKAKRDPAFEAGEAYENEFASKTDVVEFIYGDMIAEGGSVEDYFTEFNFAPCCDGLAS